MGCDGGTRERAMSLCLRGPGSNPAGVPGSNPGQLGPEAKYGNHCDMLPPILVFNLRYSVSSGQFLNKSETKPRRFPPALKSDKGPELYVSKKSS